MNLDEFSGKNIPKGFAVILVGDVTAGFLCMPQIESTKEAELLSFEKDIEDIPFVSQADKIELIRLNLLLNNFSEDRFHISDNELEAVSYAINSLSDYDEFSFKEDYKVSWYELGLDSWHDLKCHLNLMYKSKKPPRLNLTFKQRNKNLIFKRY